MFIIYAYVNRVFFVTKEYHESEIRSVLHLMGFIGNDVKKSVQHISGTRGYSFSVMSIIFRRV